MDAARRPNQDHVEVETGPTFPPFTSRRSVKCDDLLVYRVGVSVSVYRVGSGSRSEVRSEVGG